MSLVAWNVSGLYQKLGIDECRDFICSCDVIGVSETWVRNIPPDIQGMDLVAFRKAKKITANKGRASGGICVYSKCTDQFSVKEIITKDDNDVIWIEISTEVGEINVCFSYNPPVSSAYKNAAFFDCLEKQIFEHWPDDSKFLIIMGDLNARTGNQEDFYAGKDYNDCSSVDLPLRRNRDPEMNYFGKKLIRFCKTTGVRIINGRVNGDLEGELTFVSHTGKSLLDYGLASEHSFNIVNKFQVLSRIESDHLPIKLTLSCGKVNPNAELPLNEKSIAINKFSLKVEKLEEVSSEIDNNHDQLIEMSKQNSDETFSYKKFSDFLCDRLKAFKIKNKKMSARKQSTCLSECYKRRAKNALRLFKMCNSEKNLKAYLTLKTKFKIAFAEEKTHRHNEISSQIDDLYSTKNWSSLWKKIRRYSGKKLSLIHI